MISAIQRLNSKCYGALDILSMGRFRKFIYALSIYEMERNFVNEYYQASPYLQKFDAKGIWQKLIENKIFIDDSKYHGQIRTYEVLESCVFPLGMLVSFCIHKFLPNRPVKFFSWENATYLTIKTGMIFSACLASYTIAGVFSLAPDSVHSPYPPNYFDIIKDLVLISGTVEIAGEVISRLPFHKVFKGMASVYGAGKLIFGGVSKLKYYWKG